MRLHGIIGGRNSAQNHLQRGLILPLIAQGPDEQDHAPGARAKATAPCRQEPPMQARKYGAPHGKTRPPDRHT